MRTITSLFVIGFVFSLARPALAVDPNNIVTYQGRILDGNGVPVADASLDMVFKLVDDSAGTVCYWSNSSSSCTTTTTMAVTLTDGLFSVNLGDAGDGFATIGDATFADDESIYLEVIVEGETLLPRKLITAAPYAMNSQTLDGFDSSEFLAITGGTGTGDYDFSGAIFLGAIPLTFEGAGANAFETTFTITDPTADQNIIFKNESGTVAYLSDVTASASKWTDGGATTYLTSLTDDLAVGGSAPAGAAFGIDVGTMTTYIGDGSTANGNIIFKASDANTGTLTYDTTDSFVFSGGTVKADDYQCNTGDCIDFTELEDTLDLDASLILNQGTNTWTQNFAGLATTGLSFVADSLTSGTGVALSSSSLTTGKLFSVTSSSTVIDTANLVSVEHAATFTAAQTVDRSAAVFSRNLVSDTGGDIELTEPVVTISNAVSTINAGVISSGGYLLKLDQNAASGTGVMVINDDNTAGASISINKTTDSTSIDINTSTSTANIFDLDGDSLTSGNGMLLTVNSSLTTGNAFKIDYEDATPTNDRLFQIESDCTGDATCSGFSDNNSVFRIMASGEAVSDVGFTAGGASTKFYDGSITSTVIPLVMSTPTSFTFNDDASNTLATLTDNGTNGNLSVTNNITATGDLAVNGGDLTSTATSWNFDVGNTGTMFFRDGTNTLASLVDNGTTGNLNVTNDITSTGDIHVNGGDLTSTATTWNFDVGNTGTIQFRDGSNILASIVDNGTTGNFSVTNNITATGDLAVNGGDVTSTATAWNFSVGNTGTITFNDGTNTLASIVDNGTNGNFNVSNNITATGDLAVNGGDVTSSATAWRFDVGNTGTITFRDGTNSLFLIKDQGTTGDIEATGDLFVDGDNIDSAGAPLVLNATAGDEVRIGTGAPGVAVGGGDFYVTGSIEADGSLTVGQHAAIGGTAVASPDVILGVSESMASGAGFTNKYGQQIAVITGGTGSGTSLTGLNVQSENQTTAGTVTTVTGIGVKATENGAGSTVTDLFGIDSAAQVSAGVANRAYGIRATASGGGTANYSGYFYGAALRAEDTSTPSAVNFATGAGDLYVNNQFEIDGTGITNGTVMDVRPASLDTGMGAEFVYDALTTGTGLMVQKTTAGGTDFTNTTTGLVNFNITELAATGDLLYLDHDGTGSALKVNQDGDQIAMKVTATGTTDFIATFFNDGNADTNDGISIQACLDANPTTGCDLIKFFDGDGGIIGAIEGNGAGGVQLTSGGGADFAELFPGTYADFSEGDLIGIQADGSVVVASDPASVIGVLSVNRSVLGNAANENWEAEGTSVPVAMLGQVPVNVNQEGGPVAVGDYVTLSSVPGVAMKSNGVGYVIGRALEPAIGQETISVFVQPGWQAQDVLLADGTATDVLTDLEISGNVTIKNEFDETTAQITDSGDLAISGHLYPSDQGVLQTEKYIYYDGSGGPGGDFMRTNAAGWATGSYDFAEMFPSTQPLVPGEVVVFSADDEHVSRSTGLPYDDKIAGIISTRPGFLAGDNTAGDVPVALAGRVPTYVSGENGDISVGDPLTTSTRAGYAMKATQAGPIVGYAMEPFSGATGVIVAVVRPSYYDGGPVEEITEVETTASGVMTVAGLDVSGALNMNSGSISNIGSLSGIGDSWRLEEDGDFITHGRLTSVVSSYQNTDVETYAVTSRETTIQLSGTVTLQAGSAAVVFEDIDPGFNDVIANTAPYRVFLTPSAPTGQLFALNRTVNGFEVNDPAGSNGVTVDWMVVAYHKDFAPEPVIDTPAPEAVMPEIVVGEDPGIVPTTDAPVVEPIVEEPVIDPVIFEEPVTDTIMVPEPDPVPEPTPEPEVVVADPGISQTEVPPVDETPIVADPAPTP